MRGRGRSAEHRAVRVTFVFLELAEQCSVRPALEPLWAVTSVAYQQLAAAATVLSTPESDSLVQLASELAGQRVLRPGPQ